MRYDILYGPPEGVTVIPHFCREWDGDQGCYGTNPDHGFTWEEARSEVARHYETLAAQWRTMPEEPTSEEPHTGDVNDPQ